MIHRFVRTASIFCGLVAVLDAQTPEQPQHRKLWAASVVALLTATSLDAASSWHQPEANGILASPNGTFGGRAIGIKFSLAGAMVVPQILMPRWRRSFTASNFAGAGVFSGVAIRNWRTK